MSELLGNWRRTCMCAEVGSEMIGSDICVMGWVHRRRDLGQLVFMWLRDRSGMVQVVFDQSKNAALAEKAGSIRSEYVLAVKGHVNARTPENVNPALKTGALEIEATEIKILNEAATPPFHLDEENVSENFRLKYRYYDLRRPEAQRFLMTKHKVTRAVRSFLDEEGFIDLETPVLCKSTPEGARDYLVPSRVFPGEFFALPQSPQIYKQLLMVAGFDRYYQIAKCFRDEDLRADRQPEFQQIDLEMSFVDEPEVQDVAERMYKRVFRDVMGMDLPTPWPRLTYADAISLYGSDKPDTRFDMKIIQISDVVMDCGFGVFANAVKNGGSVAALNAKGAAGKFTLKELNSLTEVVKTYKAKGLAYMLFTGDNIRSTFTKYLKPEEIEAIKARCGVADGDALFFVADKVSITQKALGALRLALANRLQLIPEGKWNFLWVTQFPLLEYNEEDGTYSAAHHPFCSPMDEDIDLLDTAPEKVRCKSYDIVLNGTELASGSIRIHSSEVQEKVFSALGFSKEQAWERFGFMLGAFRYGAPPHGGIAPGLDRTVMLLSGTDNIRDVIAFPKVQSSADVMTDAPSFVDEKQLTDLGIAVRENHE